MSEQESSEIPFGRWLDTERGTSSSREEESGGGQPKNAVSRKSTTILFAILGTFAAVAWGLTFAAAAGMTSVMMTTMVLAGGAYGVAFFLALWASMMVAMMFPAAATMVRSYIGLAARQAKSTTSAVGPGALFVGTYVLVWTLFGLGVVSLYFVLAPAVPSLTSAGNLGPRLAGGVLLAAGAYQFTPLKRVCLRGCQSPFSFLLNHWRSGLSGGFKLGIRHAVFCVGCCWLLFLVLFGVGVMSIPWMAFLAMGIFAEKSFPSGNRVAFGLGILFLVIGALFLAWPAIGHVALG